MKKRCLIGVSLLLALVQLLLSGCAFRPVEGVGRHTDTTVESSDVVSDDSADSSEDRQNHSTSDPASDTTEPLGPTISPEKRVSILAVGDNIIHEAVFTDAKNRAADGAEYDFVPMYAGVTERISAADISFINQEAPLAGKEYGISGYPTFNSPREAADALVEVGFDIINLANNHILDKHVVGARASVEYLRTLPVTDIGVYLDQADRDTIRITDVNGVRIAWLSYFDLSILYYTPNMDNIWIPLMDNDETIRSEIMRAKSMADFVIVSAHWGREQPAVTAEQKRMASVMAEAGADVILGHHSHIVQPIVWNENSNGTRTLVAYSLGNFISTQYYANNMVGGMLTFDVVKNDAGVCVLENVIFRPTVTHYSMNRDGLQLYMLEDYTQELASRHGTLLHSPEFSLAYIYQLVRSVIDEAFLPEYFE